MPLFVATRCNGQSDRVKVAAAIAKQCKHRSYIRRDGCHHGRQTKVARAVKFSQQFITDGTNVILTRPSSLHDEATADYTDMIYADHAQGDREARRKTFIRKWRLKCPGRCR